MLFLDIFAIQTRSIMKAKGLRKGEGMKYFENTNDRELREFETKINGELNRLADELNTLDPTGDNYAEELSRVHNLAMARAEVISITRKRSGLDPNEVLKVAGSLIGLAAIMVYENRHVIGQHALNWIRKI